MTDSNAIGAVNYTNLSGEDRYKLKEEDLQWRHLSWFGKLIHNRKAWYCRQCAETTGYCRTMNTIATSYKTAKGWRLQGLYYGWLSADLCICPFCGGREVKLDVLSCDSL